MTTRKTMPMTIHDGFGMNKGRAIGSQACWTGTATSTERS
jgi:hypothetical protein